MTCKCKDEMCVRQAAANKAAEDEVNVHDLLLKKETDSPPSILEFTL
jgi:hypothetical protein